MKKLFALFFLVLAPALSGASSEGACGEVKCDAVKIDLHDKPSLQRGARIFINYCLSCHSAAYMRYNRMGQDLAISEELIESNLLFATDKVGDLMKAVMPAADAKDWFGTAPPDLSLEARARSPEWIYTYLRSFYRDDKSPSGWNNKVFPNVAMPHVLYEWQGHQRPLFKTDAKGVAQFAGFELERKGTMTQADYDTAMHDLTNFLVYLGEPAKLERHQIGALVLIFLAVLFVLAYFLKKAYWKDVE